LLPTSALNDLICLDSLEVQLFVVLADCWCATFSVFYTPHFYNIVIDLIKALPGNGSVNTFKRAIMEAASQWTNVIARY
jgi:hypothetical protein